MSTTTQPANPAVAAAVDSIVAIADAIKALGTVPAGTLYTHVMTHLSFEQFERITGILQKAGIIRRDPYHQLHWNLPA